MLLIELLAIYCVILLSAISSNMFQKGQSGNPKGRAKGALLTATIQRREFIAKLLEENQPKFLKELKKLEGKQYVDTILQLLEFNIPKLARVEQVGDGTGNTYNIMITNGATGNGKDNGQADNGAVIVIGQSDE